MSDYNRLRCKKCGWQGYSYQLLVDDSPFDSQDSIWACPVCKLIDGEQVIETLCDIENCNNTATTGADCIDGKYRYLCRKHYLKLT